MGLDFDFDSVLEQTEKDSRSTSLEAIVLGPSGAGKSFLFGTLPGPVLYLFASGENHGVKAAKTAAVDSKILPFCYDQNPKTLETLSPQDAYDNLLRVLQNHDWIASKNIKSVVIDGLTELEILIRSSASWRKACLTAKGSHNTFEEPNATIIMFRPVVNGLKDLQRKLGIHYAVSCILDVKEMGPTGEYLESSPRLRGYSVAESLLQQFHEVLVVGKMTNPKTNKVTHRLQFSTDITKTSKEESGAIKRTINYNPRINGLKLEELPPHMEADLSKIIEMKVKKAG